MLFYSGVACRNANAAEPAEPTQPTHIVKQIIFYVSPNGNDHWSGLLAEVNPGGNDGPFATLQRARNAIREQRIKDSNAQFTILVRGGIYRLRETLVLGPEDSGTELHPLIIRAYGNERPVLSGSRPVTDFVRYKDEIYKADLKGSFPDLNGIRQLFADGKRQVLARFPNFDPRDPFGGGFLYVADSMEGGSKVKFKFREDDLLHVVKRGDAEVVIYPGPNYWNNIVRIADIDRDRKIITLAENASYPIVAGNRFYIQNTPEALDSPGEWYFNSRAKVLYFWPANEDSLKTVSIPVLKSLLEIKEKRYFDKYGAAPANIRIEGLTFRDCEGDAIVVKGAKKATIARCTIYNAGGAGIQIDDSYGSAAIGNDVFEVGGIGIYISGGDRTNLTPGGNRAENNYIHNIGVFSKGSSGIECYGVGNIVSHNLIHSTPRIGIWFDGNDNVIEYNHVHHINQETQDSGAIYSCARDWTKRGNVVRFNYVHDSGGYGRDNADGPWRSPFYTWGIYLDDFTSGTEVTGNIVAHTGRGGIFIHGGRDNVVENNMIIEGGEKGQMVYSSIPSTSGLLAVMMETVRKIRFSKYPLLSTITGAEQGSGMSGNRFLHNIVYYTNNKSLLYDIGGSLDLVSTVSDYNVIYHAGLPLLVSSIKAPPDDQWKIWRGKGLDRNSAIADPLLSNIAGGDFSLSPASPALKIGFEPIPFEKIGLYKDPMRASWPTKD